MHSRERCYECAFRGHPCPSRYDDQYLLVNHKRHPQEMVLLEDVGQVFDGAKLVVKMRCSAMIGLLRRVGKIVPAPDAGERPAHRGMFGTAPPGIPFWFGSGLNPSRINGPQPPLPPPAAAI